MRWVTFTLLLISTMGYSAHSMAFGRCFVETAPNGKTTCFLVDNNATFICEGQGMQRTANCTTKTDDLVLCELRHTKLREPPDIWCSMPTPAPNEVGVATLMAGGERFRSVGPSESTKPNSQSSANAESCGPVPVDHGTLGYAREYNNWVRCFKRKTVTEGRIPYQDCNALVTSDSSSWDAASQQRRKQDCLDRQVGIEPPPPPKTTICNKINAQMSICN